MFPKAIVIIRTLESLLVLVGTLRPAVETVRFLPG